MEANAIIISNCLGFRRVNSPSAAPPNQPNQRTNNDEPVEQGLMDVETDFRSPKQPTNKYGDIWSK